MPPSSLVLNAERYELYVKVLAGEADGTLIYIDARGHIHIVGPDPAPGLLEQAREVLKAPIAELHKALGEVTAAMGRLKS